MSGALGSAALALLVAGCATVGAPTLVELRNGTIHGIGEGPITLRDGAWEGEPFQPGGASRPRVTLWDQPIAVGGNTVYVGGHLGHSGEAPDSA